MATRELLRRPRSFAVPAGILMLLALLLLYPSAILDGLNDSTTGALRTAPADLIVYAENAKESLLRSRIPPQVREKVEKVDGVAEAASFDVVLLGGLTPGGDKSVGLAVLTSSKQLGPKMPAPGEAYVDTSLRETAGVTVGDQVLVGPYGTSVKVVGFTHDTNLFFQSGMIVDKRTWLEALGVVLPVTSEAGPLDSGPAASDPGPMTPAPATTTPPASGPASSVAMEPASFIQTSPTLPPDPGATSPPTTFPPVTGDPFGGNSPITVPSTTASSTPASTTTTAAPATTTTAPGAATTGADPATTGTPGSTVPGEQPGGTAGQADDPLAGLADTTQTLFITVEPGADPEAVARAVDKATDGETDTVTREDAVQSLPGMSQQSTTFGYIRGVTLGVALVVVGLFLSFVTLERTPLYAVLKALGMSSRQLFTGVVIQVLLVTLTAALVATVATWGLTHVPLDLPTSMRPVRFVETVVALGTTSVVGSVLSLRRVVRVDPASAIG